MDLTIGIDVSFDMGWQKRSSGHQYNSMSGHAFLIGMQTKKVIAAIVYCKQCSICDAHEKMARCGFEDINRTVPFHNCPRNHKSGSSKAMEADAGVHLCLWVFQEFNRKVYVDKFVSDDDSSTRKKLDPSKNDTLPSDFPKPTFLADLNHCVKVIFKPIFGLAALNQALSSCTKGDALRLKRNFSWYIKTAVRDP